jgi:polysaccharide pyruvyl transferase WcaK-like protein
MRISRAQIRAATDLAGQPKDWIVRRAAGARLPQAPASDGRRALVLPPFSPGSLGDEALVEGTLAELRRRGWLPTLIEYRRERRWGPAKGSPSLDMSAYFHLDHNVAPFSRRDLAAFRSALGGYSRFVMIGADILDGYYNSSRTTRRLLLAHLAARAGLDTAVISCSLNGIPTRRALAELRALPTSVRFVVRDELSHARMESVLGRPCQLGADVAFLMEPDGSAPPAPDVAAWMAAQRAAGRMVIGANLNLDPFRFNGTATEAEAVAVHVGTVRRLLAGQQTAVMYMSHDWRGKPSEEQLAERMAAGLEPEERERVHLARGPYTAMTAKAMVGQVDFLVTGRMHLSIGAIAQAVPTALLPYQDKFEGLVRHLRVDGVVLDVRRALREGTLTPQLEPLIARREEIRRGLRAELPRVLSLSRSNLD